LNRTAKENYQKLVAGYAVCLQRENEVGL